MENEEKLKRAKKRIEQIREFYTHLAVYIVVNLIIAAVNLNQFGWRTEDGYLWAIFSTPVFWGIGLAFHALHVFGINGIFGKKWEERQIAKFMEQDRRKSKKYQ